MPISSTGESPGPSQAAIDANRLGTMLRAQGRLTEAAQAFARGTQLRERLPELHLNLAVTLTELQQFERAQQEYALVLDLRPGDTSAHWGLYELEQMAGNRERALEHQAAALQKQTIFSSYAPRQQRRLIALMGPGDWQANVPIDYLIDPQTSTLHKVYLTSEEQARALELPQADVLFTAMAQSPENSARFEWAQRIAGRTNIPVVNGPAFVAAADRVHVWTHLQELEHVRVPETMECSREQLEQNGERTFPLIVRPVSSQAGRDLQKLGDPAELAAYMRAVNGSSFYVMPFVDYSNADRFFRKYRIFVVDGKPYPCHLGISKNWMIHYYNTPMREYEWMRDEERYFLQEFESVFPAHLRKAMTQVARALHLDYVGLDCTMDAQGNLLVFEADPAMIVHAADDPAVFAYKHVAARAIFAAFAELIDRARPR